MKSVCLICACHQIVFTDTTSSPQDPRRREKCMRRQDAKSNSRPMKTQNQDSCRCPSSTLSRSLGRTLTWLLRYREVWKSGSNDKMKGLVNKDHNGDPIDLTGEEWRRQRRRSSADSAGCGCNVQLSPPGGLLQEKDGRDRTSWQKLVVLLCLTWTFSRSYFAESECTNLSLIVCVFSS